MYQAKCIVTNLNAVSVLTSMGTLAKNSCNYSELLNNIYIFLIQCSSVQLLQFSKYLTITRPADNILTEHSN